MINLLDGQWVLYIAERDETIPDARRARIHNWRLSLNGIVLEIEQSGFVLCREVNDRADVARIKRNWEKIVGRTLQEANETLAAERRTKG